MNQAEEEFYPNTGGALAGMLFCIGVGSAGLLLLFIDFVPGLFGAMLSVMGIAGLDTFLSLSRLQVVVGPEGIAKHTRSWLGGFEARWSDIAGWTVERSNDEETPGMRTVRFRVPSGIVEVTEGNVSATGLESFLAAVRRHIGAREKPG